MELQVRGSMKINSEMAQPGGTLGLREGTLAGPRIPQKGVQLSDWRWEHDKPSPVLASQVPCESETM